MKKIQLIETFPNGLNAIKSYLSEINTDYLEFSSINEAIESGELPSLVVLLANKNLEKFKKDIENIRNTPSFSKISRILILPLGMHEIMQRHEIIDGESSFPVSVDKLKFISTVSRFLKRSPRRVFRIIITIQQEGSKVRYSGVSLDFSETGMAFESILDRPTGHKIKVTFVNPRIRKRILLKAKIVRRAATQPGSTIFYGVKFIEMSEQNIKDLMSFLTGER